MHTPSVLLICYEPLLRLGLRHFLLSEAGFAKCDVAVSLPGALDCLMKLRPTLVVLASSCECGDLPRVVRDIRRCQADARVLLLVRPGESDLLHRVVEAGALGFATLVDGLDELKCALAAVLEGSFHVSRLAMAGMKVHVDARSSGPVAVDVKLLSDREKEVFECMGRELGTKDIAFKLGISVKTVETHQKRIKEKLHLRKTAEVKLAAATGKVKLGGS
jgi:DNA-binding NarL/FixJ family response regulator